MENILLKLFAYGLIVDDHIGYGELDQLVAFLFDERGLYIEDAKYEAPKLSLDHDITKGVFYHCHISLTKEND